MVSEVSVEAGVFSLLDRFLGFGVSEGSLVFDESVLLTRLDGFGESLSFDDLAGVSQVFCTTAYCVCKSTGSAYGLSRPSFSDLICPLQGKY